jgi:hypothetical protein
MKLISGVCIVLTLSFSSVADSQQESPAAGAKRWYENAFRATKGQRWDLAARYFRLSYELVPCPITAYWLSLSYAHLNQSREARDSAEWSVTTTKDECSPPMREQYVQGARKLMREIDRGVQPRTIVEVHCESNFDVDTLAEPSEETVNVSEAPARAVSPLNNRR